MSQTQPHASELTPAPAPSRALRVYVALVVAAGGLSLIGSAGELARASHPWQWILFGACGILTGSFTINFVAVSASISVADTFFIQRLDHRAVGSGEDAVF